MKGIVTKKCKKSLLEYADYIAQNSIKQSDLMLDSFNEIASKICKNPKMGRPYKNDMRKISLGKHKYHVIYKITKNRIEFLSIWSMRRNKEFKE